MGNKGDNGSKISRRPFLLSSCAQVFTLLRETTVFQCNIELLDTSDGNFEETFQCLGSCNREPCQWLKVSPGRSRIPGRGILRFFYCTALCLYPSRHADAQSSNPRGFGQPVPILLRSISSNPPSAQVAYYQSAPAPTDPPRIPATDLRVIYPPDSTTFIPQFPRRIRFTQSRLEETRNVSGITAQPRTDPESFQEIDGVVNRGVALPVLDDADPNRRIAVSVNDASDLRFPLPILENDNSRLVLPVTDDQAHNGAVASVGSFSSKWPAQYRWNETEADRSRDQMNRTELLNMSSRLLMKNSEENRRVLGGPLDVPEGTSTEAGSAHVGSITVGAFVGIICGLVTTVVLVSIIGLFCYRRRHPTWNTAETDLRVLATHYGSYWDDKTLPHYQFNDRMTWPGETHEEMIALDNDAFLKSLEDLGRVSRPSSKTSWNANDPDLQRQSTKV